MTVLIVQPRQPIRCRHMYPGGGRCTNPGTHEITDADGLVIAKDLCEKHATRYAEDVLVPAVADR